MRATDKELQAMATLSSDQRFQTYVEYLGKWLKDETKQCIEAEEPRVNQGRAQVLTEIMATIDEARESVQKRVAVRAVADAQGNGSNAF